MVTGICFFLALILRNVFNVSLPCQTETTGNNDVDPDITETAYLDNSQYLDAACT